VKWASETLVRLGGIPRGAVGGVDLAPERLGLDEGWGRCHRRPPPPGGDSTDDYAGATTCEMEAPSARLHFALGRAVDAVVALRLAPRPGAEGARLVVLINGHALSPVVLESGWREPHLDAPAALWQVGRNEVELRVDGPAGVAADVDHLLAIPRRGARDAKE
jgi:hypothetical protein